MAEENALAELTRLFMAEDGYLPVDEGNRRQREEEKVVQPNCMRCDGEIAWEACGALS